MVISCPGPWHSNVRWNVAMMPYAHPVGQCYWQKAKQAPVFLWPLSCTLEQEVWLHPWLKILQSVCRNCTVMLQRGRPIYYGWNSFLQRKASARRTVWSRLERAEVGTNAWKFFLKWCFQEVGTQKLLLMWCVLHHSISHFRSSMQSELRPNHANFCEHVWPCWKVPPTWGGGIFGIPYECILISFPCSCPHWPSRKAIM